MKTIITDALRLRVQPIDHGTTRVHIALGTHSTEGSDLLLSNACHCASELRQEADHLIRQLNKIKTAAEKIDWKGIAKGRW